MVYAMRLILKTIEDKLIMKLKSENIGGILSFIGSLIPILAGDVHSVVAALLFFFAEVMFMRKGHTTAGYSLGALGFAGGDYVLAAATTLGDNTSLRIVLVLMAVSWTVGVLRWPLEKISQCFQQDKISKRLKRAADLIQPLVGVSNVVMKLSGVVTAALGGNFLILIATSLWAMADVLCGRLQDYALSMVRTLRGNRSTSVE